MTVSDSLVQLVSFTAENGRFEIKNNVECQKSFKYLLNNLALDELFVSLDGQVHAQIFKDSYPLSGDTVVHTHNVMFYWLARYLSDENYKVFLEKITEQKPSLDMNELFYSQNWELARLYLKLHIESQTPILTKVSIHERTMESALFDGKSLELLYQTKEIQSEFSVSYKSWLAVSNQMQTLNYAFVSRSLEDYSQTKFHDSPSNQLWVMKALDCLRAHAQFLISHPVEPSLQILKDNAATLFWALPFNEMQDIFEQVEMTSHQWCGLSLHFHKNLIPLYLGQDVFEKSTYIQDRYNNSRMENAKCSRYELFNSKDKKEASKAQLNLMQEQLFLMQQDIYNMETPGISDLGELTRSIDSEWKKIQKLTNPNDSKVNASKLSNLGPLIKKMNWEDFQEFTKSDMPSLPFISTWMEHHLSLADSLDKPYQQLIAKSLSIMAFRQPDYFSSIEKEFRDWMISPDVELKHKKMVYDSFVFATFNSTSMGRGLDRHYRKSFYNDFDGSMVDDLFAENKEKPYLKKTIDFVKSLLTSFESFNPLTAINTMESSYTIPDENFHHRKVFMLNLHLEKVITPSNIPTPKKGVFDTRF